MSAVVDGLAVATGGEQAALAQGGQPFAGGGLGDAQAFGDLADGQLGVAGELQHELLAALVGQGLEEAAGRLTEFDHGMMMAVISSFRELPIPSSYVDG